MSATYLDYNATAPLRPQAKEAMMAVMDAPANASSVHSYGQHAAQKLETARQQIAALADANSENVIFTSGGTEANNQALRGFPGRVIITTPVEHSAVLAAVSDEAMPEALLVDVDKDGLIDLDHLENLLRSYRGGALVSVQGANNETGVIQPLAEVVALARQYDAITHSDAVQNFGKDGFTGLRESGVDMLSISAHKIGGPVGVGALLVRENLPIPPLLLGGGQERRRRGGTENLIGIVGFGAAAEAVRESGTAWLKQLRQCHQKLEERLISASDDAVVFGRDVARLPNTTAIAMQGRRAETQVMHFDLADIAVSAGAACSSGKVASSHVLEAMGAGGLAGETIRVSSGWASRPEDFDRFAEIWLQLQKKPL